VNREGAAARPAGHEDDDVINDVDNIIEQERNKKRTDGRRWRAVEIENAYLCTEMTAPLSYMQPPSSSSLFEALASTHVDCMVTLTQCRRPS